jgi:DNA polymerase sigma
MIAFMKFIRQEQDSQAKDVLSRYGNDTKVFIEKAREFLKYRKLKSDGDFVAKTQVHSAVDDEFVNGSGLNIISEQQCQEDTVVQQEEDAKVSNNDEQVVVHDTFTVEVNEDHHRDDTSELEKMVANLIVEDECDEFSSDITTQGRDILQRDANAVPSISEPTSSTSDAIDEKKELPPPPTQSAKGTTTTAPTRWQPKRLNMKLQEQPGRLLANNVPATINGKPSIAIRPRQELIATWQLPLSYLRERTMGLLQKAQEEESLTNHGGQIDGDHVVGSTPSLENVTIRDALRTLTVGLFRRGCAENGLNAAIIAKEIVPSDKNAKEEFHFEINHQNGIIWGNVPFFTPRTPGNIVLRLYFEDDPSMTLATSQCISVVVTHIDLEQTLRFILSNFKSKRNATNFSSMHFLAAVLEQYSPDPHTKGKSKFQNNSAMQNMDGAGRAAWGGICESRKIMDAGRQEYLQKKLKLDERVAELEQMLNETDANINNPAESALDPDDESHQDDDERKGWKEDLKQALKERALNERNWRDIQTSFASVLKSVIRNPGSSSLLKPDIIKKLELEYNLWCPLCERFAPNPFEVEHGDGSFSINYPYPISQKHHKACLESRAKMQEETIGFVVKTTPITPSSYQEESSVCMQLTKDMEMFFNLEHGSNSLVIYRKKSVAREQTQAAVVSCNSFPNGTEVVVFGSSANGFGSPNSDLDMCLQLPKGMTLTGEDGLNAMIKLAEKLEETGMINVDTARLTARIPVIKFECIVDIDGSKSTIECDISMQNPLACINTSLLYSYSLISPAVRVLAAVVKCWASRRNINDPSHHTLSSYGYIIMLLHFLTTHKTASDGRLEAIFKSSGFESPLLPNLQWVDQRWLQSPPGTRYLEWQSKPTTHHAAMKHPFEPSYVVNTYFLRTNDEAVLTALRNKIRCESTNPPPVGYLLAAFFRYYAFQFDYKKYVVSLNATSHSGLVEREIKAEFDGWKSAGQTLSVEDPFEEFYDVAHVLTNFNFQRIRKEFALAYSKIASCMSDEGFGKLNGDSLLDIICEEVSNEQHVTK